MIKKTFKKAIVISNESQWQAFKQMEGDHSWSIFCDSPAFEVRLQQEKVSYQLLDEFLLKEKWAEINSWGCAKAAGWCGATKMAGIFSEVDLASTIYLFFSLFLVQMLKNYHFAKHILDRSYDEVVISETSQRKKYPQFSGNAYLNVFLHELAVRSGYSTKRIVLFESAQDNPRIPIKRRLQNQLRKGIERMYSWITPKTASCELLSFGSLRHLASTLIALKQRGLNVCLYDFEFHFEQFAFAKKNNIPYVVPSCLKTRHPHVDEFSNRCVTELNRAIDHPVSDDFFNYDGYYFKEFIREHIFNNTGDYFKRIALESENYEALFESFAIENVLVDEDYALRGAYFAAFTKARHKKVFCISHANPTLACFVPENSRKFSQSLTFVQSQHEKEMYAARGWNPENILVTGTPRYDPLCQKRDQEKKSNSSFKLLYAANTDLKAQKADDYGYLGSHLGSFKSISWPSVQSILKAIEFEPSIELIFKPHNFESAQKWKRIIVELKPKNKITIINRSIGIHELFSEADAVILSYWTTVIVETMLYGLPTIYLDLKDFTGPILETLDAANFIEVARSTEELKEKLKMLINNKKKNKQKPGDSDLFEYYFGRRDGESTSRVADTIAKSIKDENSLNLRKGFKSKATACLSRIEKT
jgi:CDP-glycerol glycerophosphotransferase (TagB/SpsB family)